MTEETQLDPLEAEALSLAALPPPSEAELRALAAAKGGTLHAWRRSNAHRHAYRRAAAGLLVAAAAAAVVLAPGAFRKTPRVAQPEAAAAWTVPDLDAIWKKAGGAVGDSGADADGDADESASTALFAELEL
jgi:hypothetical protein